MHLSANISVLLLALIGVSSAAVDRHTPQRGRHLAAAVVHRDLGDIISNIGDLLGGTTTTTTDSSTTDPVTETETDTDTDTDTDIPTTTDDESTTPSPTSTTPDDEPTTSDEDESTTPEPTSTTTDDEEASTTPGPTSSACEPLVLLGITIPCGEEPTGTSLIPDDSTTSSDPEPTISSSSGTITDEEPSTTDAPTTMSDEEPSTTDAPTTTSDEESSTTAPPEECTPLVLAGITISGCGETTTTTDPEPTTTTDDDDDPTVSPTSTQTQGPDPCDPNLLDPILGGILPDWCNPGPTTTATQPPPTDTDEPNPPGPTTTFTQPPPTDTDEPNPPETTSNTTPTLTVPNPFPEDTDTHVDPTWSTTSVRTDDPGPTFTIPDFLTQTQSLGLDELPTTTANPTETDPDAAPTLPESQTVPTLNPTALPNNLPAYILSSSAPTSVPPGTTLISLLLGPSLNWNFVATEEETALQLMTYIPIVLINALGVEQNEVPMLALQAFVPNNWDGKPQTLLTLAQLYLRTDLISELAQQLSTPNSPFFTNQRDPISKALVLQVVPSYPLTASSGSNDPNTTGGTAAGGNLGGLLGNTGGDSGDETRKRAIIGVCAAIGGALLVGAVWWAYKNHQHKREQAHRRLSQNSDTQFAAAGGLVPDYGAGGMQERGRRDSFFFAADSLRGFEDGRFHDDSETYDHRSTGGMTGGALSARGPGSSGHGHGGMGGQAGSRYSHGSPQPIQTGAISQPILRENTLNW